MWIFQKHARYVSKVENYFGGFDKPIPLVVWISCFIEIPKKQEMRYSLPRLSLPHVSTVDYLYIHYISYIYILFVSIDNWKASLHAGVFISSLHMPV